MTNLVDEEALRVVSRTLTRIGEYEREVLQAYEKAKLDKAVAKDTTAKDFIEEITKAGGKYAYLNDTPIAADAYAVLRELDKATATPIVVGREIKLYPSLSTEGINLDKLDRTELSESVVFKYSTDGATFKDVPPDIIDKVLPIKSTNSDKPDKVEPPKVPEELFVCGDSPYEMYNDTINALIDCVNYLMNKEER